MDLPDAGTQGLVVAVGQQDIQPGPWLLHTGHQYLKYTARRWGRTPGVPGTAGQEAGRVQY